ncbi:hypothetical protein [Paenibacillus sp. FSL K6-0108]
MVEMHCHILSGLNDGPVAMEQSIAMAEKRQPQELPRSLLLRIT